MAPANPFDLSGKRALIAGASRGIGQAIAEGMARAGAHVVAAARSLPALEEIAGRLRGEGLQAVAVELDISSRESRQRAVDTAGDVDILVNVAGMNLRKRFTEYTPEEYERLLRTNLTGIFELTQAVGRGMIDRGRGGKVVMIGSLTSMLGLPYVTVYTVTKAALAGLTRSLAAEWGGHNIQVNCIAPGFILTDLNREMWKPPHMTGWLQGVQPNPRMGRPDDIAPLAVFLGGPGSDYITGQVIAVDGGLSTTTMWPFQPA
ncbi:MAG: SDR family oxidoreductase [Acidobacteria bacterium]|nr:SDR family oxidoreductase [Acidobacteriota bacterium]